MYYRQILVGSVKTPYFHLSDSLCLHTDSRTIVKMQDLTYVKASLAGLSRAVSARQFHIRSFKWKELPSKNQKELSELTGTSNFYALIHWYQLPPPASYSPC